MAYQYLDLSNEEGVQKFKSLFVNAFQDDNVNMDLSDGSALTAEIGLSGEDVFRGNRFASYESFRDNQGTTSWERLTEGARICAYLSFDSYARGYINIDEDRGLWDGYAQLYFMYTEDRTDTSITNIRMLPPVETPTDFPIKYFNGRTDGTDYQDAEYLRTIASDSTARITDNFSLSTFVDSTKFENFFCECNIPVFPTISACANYLLTGNTNLMLNGDGGVIPEFKAPKEYYFEEFIQRYDNPDFIGEKVTVERKKNYFFADSNNFRIVGYIKENAGQYYNIIFKASATDAESSVFFGTHVKDGGTRVPLTVALFNLGSNEWNRGLKGSKESGDYTYYAAPNTNIPIVGSKAEADKYLDREKDIDELKQVKLNDSNINVKHTGDDTADQTEQVLNQGYGEPLLSTQYICTNAEMEAIANILFTQTDSTETALAEGLKRYGENPINDVIDIYHTPIDLSDFITVSAGNRVRFGSYRSEATASRITAHGNIKTLGTVNIMPVFNDFRDYDGTLEIELYLPFAGTMPLDIHSYMNRALTIKATADTRAHNIRYYLFSDGALMTFRDCAFGKSISMMGNDVASKYHQNISSEIGINASERSLALTAFGTGVSMASGNFKAGLGGIMSLAQGVSNLEAQREMQSLDRYHTQAPRTFAGSQSAGCSESDILYPYLIFRIQQSSTPDNLLETFGRPCNIINKIGNFSGYTQIENAHLETSATLEEINEINSLLTQGIIL